jgi:2',3'-cyclic-nucleotide 2'-phosphodiesterase (5'-nucleotidase family)
MQQFNIERDELAPRLKNVDVIIAGGSNTILTDSGDRLRSDSTKGGDYPTIKKDANNQNTLILNTDGNYRYVGRLVVGFDDSGNVDLGSLNPTLNGAFATDSVGVDFVYGSDVDPKNEANANVVAVTDALRKVVATKDNTLTGKTTFFRADAGNQLRQPDRRCQLGIRKVDRPHRDDFPQKWRRHPRQHWRGCSS